MSSRSQVIKDIPLEHRETSHVFHNENECFKIPRIIEDYKSDHFKFHLSVFSGIITKRYILSNIAPIFDPSDLFLLTYILFAVVLSTLILKT